MRSKKLKLALHELGQEMEVICNEELTCYKGGSGDIDGEHFTLEEYMRMLMSGTWMGGYVEGIDGYVPIKLKEVVAEGKNSTGNYNNEEENPSGYMNGYDSSSGYSGSYYGTSGDYSNDGGVPLYSSHYKEGDPLKDDVNNGVYPFSFEKGKTYKIDIVNRTYADIGAIISAGYSELIISYNGETIKSSSFSLGAGYLGEEVFTKVTSSEITFFQDMSGQSLLEVFNKTGMTQYDSFGGVLTWAKITGYDSAYKMNKLWEVKLFGAGLKAGFSSSRSTEPFKKVK